jgi:hypothetical protein
MSFGYWFKIVLGMLVIFAIGAFGVQAFHKGKDLVNSDRPFEIPMLGATFKLAGERLGKVERLRIERSSPRSVSGVALTVNLDDSIPMTRLDHCSLSATELNSKITFACALPADSSRLNLVPFGTVTFRPGDHQVVLLVPQSVVSDLQHNISTGAGFDESGNVDVGSDSGSLHVRVNGKDVVSIIGDSNGGSIKVFDKQGNAIVDIAGDSNGGRVMVKDSTGKTKVNVKSSTPPRKPNSP